MLDRVHALKLAQGHLAKGHVILSIDPAPPLDGYKQYDRRVWVNCLDEKGQRYRFSMSIQDNGRGKRLSVPPT